MTDMIEPHEGAWNRTRAARVAATVDASATRPPGEGHRTGTGGPDAPGASEGLDAAIEAAAEALWRHAQRGQFDKLAWADIPDHWRPEKFEQAEAAVRAAEPILRQALAEDIARRIEVLEDYEAAEIAREVGRGQ